MILWVLFIGVAIVYFLFQKSKINRIQKQEYLKQRKEQQIENLLKLARKQDEMNEKENVNENSSSIEKS